MIRLNLPGKDIVRSFSHKARGKPSEMFAGEGVELSHYMSVAEPLDIVAETDQALEPHARLGANGPWRLVLKISYHKYSLCFGHIGAHTCLNAASG